jgi:hypothetical protein
VVSFIERPPQRASTGDIFLWVSDLDDEQLLLLYFEYLRTYHLRPWDESRRDTACVIDNTGTVKDQSGLSVEELFESV